MRHIVNNRNSSEPGSAMIYYIDDTKFIICNVCFGKGLPDEIKQQKCQSCHFNENDNNDISKSTSNSYTILCGSCNNIKIIKHHTNNFDNQYECCNGLGLVKLQYCRL